MKMQLTSMLLLLGVALSIFTGCKKDDSLISPSDPTSVKNADALSPASN